jgi:hypothetical protein
MINTLYTKKKSGKIVDKQAIVTVQAIVEKAGRKRIGFLKLNLA